MVLVIKRENTIKYPVTVQVPNEDGSKSVKTAIAIFSTVSHERILQISEEARKKREAGEDISSDSLHLLREVLKGWEGIKTDTVDGPDLPFNKTTFAAVMNIPYVREAFVSAYIHAVCERAEALCDEFSGKGVGEVLPHQS
ncbi:hypothetical protein [Azospirillum doebereinerae]